MAEKEPVFLSLPPEEDSEYSLDFTKVHEEFEEIVQSQIGAFLEVEGVSMAEFGEMVRRLARLSLLSFFFSSSYHPHSGSPQLVNARNIPAGDSEESSQAAAFVELLVGLVEFRAFVDIMRSRDKVGSFCGGGWGKTGRKERARSFDGALLTRLLSHLLFLSETTTSRS